MKGVGSMLSSPLLNTRLENPSLSKHGWLIAALERLGKAILAHSLACSIGHVAVLLFMIGLLFVGWGETRALADTAGNTHTLQCGFARVDITPQRPTPMAGYYRERLSEDTHDPLWAKATVIDDGVTRVAIVTLDLVSTNSYLVSETRKLVFEKTGILEDRVMISATHSHTGPVLYNPMAESYSRFGGDHESTKQYMYDLPQKITAAVENAVQSLQPVSVRQAETLEPQLGFNRRFFMKDGTVGWNPGKLNPNIIREAGPTDDRLNYACFYDQENRLVAIHASFAIHLDTVGGTAWSADMPYEFERALQASLGRDLHVQYMTGCCGDINHLDVRTAMPQKGHEEAARIGTRLAAAVLRSLTDLEATTGKQIFVVRELLHVPSTKFTSDELSWAESIIAKANNPTQPPFMDMVRAFRIADSAARKSEPIPVEVSSIAVGQDLAWVFLPGEIFVQLGMDIKAASPYQTTFIPELANGSIGYVPTRQAYPQGTYEVISARCAQGSGEMMVDAAIAQLMQHYQSRARSGSK